MKTLMLAAIRCSLMFTAVAALSLAYPASVQAVPTTYHYTGNPFTFVFPPIGPYTTSDFVSGMVTLAGPLPPNFSGEVTPRRFTFTDGVQTISNENATPGFSIFSFTTGPTGQILHWLCAVGTGDQPTGLGILTQNSLTPPVGVTDEGSKPTETGDISGGANVDNPGTWTRSVAPDAGSSLALLSLSLMALGLVARRFQWAAGLTAPRAGRSRSHDAVIRVYDEAGCVIETHEHARAISKSGEVHFFVALPNERTTSPNGETLAPALLMKALVS
jgi:hypothetical protein